MKASSTVRVLLLLTLLLPLGGCLFRSRKVERVLTVAELKEATKDQLVAFINQQAAKIETLNLTVDIDTDVGGAKRGKVTEYQQIRGYILVRKPTMLRMIGLLPVVRSRAFDMVSDGNAFKLSIPAKNRFIIGRNDIVHPSQNALENIRPQHIYDALLLRAIDPKNEIAVLEEGMETLKDPKDKKKEIAVPTYSVTVIHRVDPATNDWILSRKIIFSREDLLPHEQIVYDKQGNVATDAKYEQFQDQGGVMFPQQIVILRPQEEYSITLTLVKFRLNEPLKDDQFALAQPVGAQLLNLDQPHAPESTPEAPTKSKDGHAPARPKPADTKDEKPPS